MVNWKHGRFANLPQEHRDIVDRYIRDKQDDSVKGAVRRGTIWSEQEDDIVMMADLTQYEKAELLERTWFAISSRRTILRNLAARGLKPDYTKPEREAMTVQTKPIKILCPCGTIDGDHDSWCPENKENS